MGRRGLKCTITQFSGSAMVEQGSENHALKDSSRIPSQKNI
jgi:hypothetical protein